jgi:GT2 family glycosyltransferase
MNLVLQLSTYRSAKFLPSLFASLAEQTDRDWTLMVRDDGSGNPEEIRAILDAWTEKFAWTFTAGENCGFSGSHQKMYTEHRADLVLLVNHDVVMTPRYIETVRSILMHHADVGAVEGVILRARWNGDGAVCTTDIVDSLGLMCMPWHAVHDIDSGRLYRKPVPEMVDRFGVSGCLPMYRRSALGEVLFDAKYWMYKEDVDVAYRLRESGWRSVVTGYAIAYHVRGVQQSLFHSAVSEKFQAYSYRNHLWNLRKHLSRREWWKKGWCILPYEVMKALFLLLRFPRVLYRVWMEKSLDV